jgi:hypothetical protein
MQYRRWHSRSNEEAGIDKPSLLKQAILLINAKLTKL